MTKRFIETSFRLLLVALAITLIVPLGAGTAVEDGMVLYLSFDEAGDLDRCLR